jgi:hypothetical protein
MEIKAHHPRLDMVDVFRIRGILERKQTEVAFGTFLEKINCRRRKELINHKYHNINKIIVNTMKL